MKKELIHKSEQLYEWLLRLYPQKFKRQFGEEMKFVFSESLRDAYEQDGGKGLFVLLGWTFIDVFISLFNEHLQERKEEPPMSLARFVTLRNAALTGFLMVLPFMLLEAITTSGFAHLGFPLGLFIFMWLLAAIFALLLLPIVQTIRAGNIAMANPLFLALRVILMLLIAWAWIGLVVDQMPCFLAVPNCD
jgi:hypothetical protein